ncbi:hypothetical protein [Leptolyngbya ohadii]|uniref:hypothetical protein n=1 Tax=Leptolyngbya ohadii TaxID=1962290 RepID=UPI000B599B90|nr:hypothetical protein [Leptolyngbya ohadii]
MGRLAPGFTAEDGTGDIVGADRWVCCSVDCSIGVGGDFWSQATIDPDRTMVVIQTDAPLRIVILIVISS